MDRGLIMQTSTIVIIVVSFSAGLLTGVIMAMSRAQRAHRFIAEAKTWATNEHLGDRGWTYRQAQQHIRAKIHGYEEGL